jgi:phosphoglycolate phosphatase
VRLAASTGVQHRRPGTAATEPGPEDGKRAFERSYATAVDGGALQPLPGATEAIDKLRANGVKVCLTTGFGRPTLDRILDTLGWRDGVDLALCPKDAGRGRPYPDMILTAVLRLAVNDVREVAVAGDTASDVLSGRRAGAAIVAGVLTGAHTRSQLEEAGATHVLESVADVPRLLW